MTADARLYKDPKQALGMPEDEKATNATDSWSMIALLKGLYHAFTVTGINVTFAAGNLGTGTADAALRTVEASNSPVTTALQIVDDWDEADRAKVNIIAGQAGVAAGAGAVAATVQRVTLASDDPGVVSLAILDDWDESDRAKVNLIVGQAGIAAGAGAVGVTVPRVTLASDDPGVVALQIIDDWDESDRAKVNLVVGQAGITAGAGAVAANTPRVTHASDDPLVTKATGPATGTQSNVAGSASDGTILASNASRKGAAFYNDSSAILYLLLANATSSSTLYTVQIPASGYYELPVNQGGVYTGVVKGIWASATGACRVTELT